MEPTEIRQLTELRDILRLNRSELSLKVLDNYIKIKYSTGRGPIQLLVDDDVVKALWFCLCNNNVGREELIKRLDVFLMLVGHENKDDRTIIISILLFLAGVDFQINAIELPESEVLPFVEHGVSNYAAIRRDIDVEVSPFVEHGVKNTRASKLSKKVKWLGFFGFKKIVWSMVIVIAISFAMVFSCGYFSTMHREDKCKDFVERYCDATNHHNYPEIEKLYASHIQRYYSSYNISRDSVMQCYKKYEEKFRAHNPNVIVDWNTLEIQLTKDGLVSLSFLESYTMDREDESRCSMWIIEKFFLLDKDNQIVQEYEEIKKGK